ncbi:MAG: hypothetical protein ACRDC4_16990, partial [Plesiomonas sp.]
RPVMEDLEHIGVDKLTHIIDLYGELRERFKSSEHVYDPHAENRAFAIEQLGLDPEMEGFGDMVEGCDLFLGNVHALFTIKENPNGGNWDVSVGNFHNFLANSSDDEWIRPVIGEINRWIDNLNIKVEIPY